MSSAFHTPVLCHTVLEKLVTDADGIYVDATLGGGGHSAALLEALSPRARVIGIDCDREAIQAAQARLGGASNFTAVRGTFAKLCALLEEQRLAQVDGLLLDLGVSSHQLDHAPRGFSYRKAAAPDMRMDQRSAVSAATLLNSWTQAALTQVLFAWGEEPRARRIAQAITAARPIETTTDLATVIRRVVPTREETKILARVFQALRIAVNNEMEAVEAVLSQAAGAVAVGGRLVVISYHSLEDRRVKRMMRHGNLAGTPIRDVYGRSLSCWRPLHTKPIMASEAEVQRNPRARSAKLRAAERVRIPDGITTN